MYVYVCVCIYNFELFLHMQLKLRSSDYGIFFISNKFLLEYHTYKLIKQFTLKFVTGWKVYCASVCIECWNHLNSRYRYRHEIWNRICPSPKLEHQSSGTLVKTRTQWILGSSSYAYKWGTSILIPLYIQENITQDRFLFRHYSKQPHSR